MQKLKKIFCSALVACISLLPLSACKDKDDGVKTLQINEVTHSVFYAPLYLADALGYFEEEKIKIELTNGGGADNVMSAVLSGDADIGFAVRKRRYTYLSAVRATYQRLSVNLPNATARFSFRASKNPTLSGKI